MSRKKMIYRLFRSCVFYCVVVAVLAAASIAWAAFRVEYGGRVTTVEVPAEEYQGRVYVEVATLFSQIGGIVYYSPIMQKVHLTFRHTKWVLSMDKGVAVSETGEEVRLGQEIFIEGTAVFATPDLLSRLLGIDITAADVAEDPAPSPTPFEVAPDVRMNILRGVRYSTEHADERTRITFDFVSDPPSHVVEVDNPSRRVLLRFDNCSLGSDVSSVQIGDSRTNRVEFREVNNAVEVAVVLNAAVKVDKGVLGGVNPRIFIDIEASPLAEREPLIEVIASPTPTPLDPTPTPVEPTPTPLEPTPTPEEELLFDKINPRLVVIDPGHGGRDPGAIANGLREKDVVLDISRKLRDELVRQGFEVIMTREGDTYPTLQGRTSFANHQNPLLFLSVHANAAPNLRAEGVEAFVGSARYSGEGAEEVARRENEFFVAEGQARPPVTQGRDTTILESLYYGSRQVSAEAGEKITSNIVAVTGQRNRGLKEAPLLILKNMFFPAVLLEVGFLTNSAEAQRLANPDFHDKLVQGIVRGIKELRESQTIQQFLED